MLLRGIFNIVCMRNRIQSSWKKVDRTIEYKFVLGFLDKLEMTQTPKIDLY